MLIRRECVDKNRLDTSHDTLSSDVCFDLWSGRCRPVKISERHSWRALLLTSMAQPSFLLLSMVARFIICIMIIQDSPCLCLPHLVDDFDENLLLMPPSFLSRCRQRSCGCRDTARQQWPLRLASAEVQSCGEDSALVTGSICCFVLLLKSMKDTYVCVLCIMCRLGWYMCCKMLDCPAMLMKSTAGRKRRRYKSLGYCSSIPPRKERTKLVRGGPLSLSLFKKGEK